MGLCAFALHALALAHPAQQVCAPATPRAQTAPHPQLIVRQALAPAAIAELRAGAERWGTETFSHGQRDDVASPGGRFLVPGLLRPARPPDGRPAAGRDVLRKRAPCPARASCPWAAILPARPRLRADVRGAPWWDNYSPPIRPESFRAGERGRGRLSWGWRERAGAARRGRGQVTLNLADWLQIQPSFRANSLPSLEQL